MEKFVVISVSGTSVPEKAFDEYPGRV